MLAIICTNEETLVDGQDIENGLEAEAANAYYEAAAEVLAKADCEVEVDSVFSNWHGGKFGNQAPMYGYQYCGRIAVDHPDLVDVAFEADDAGLAAMQNYSETP